MCIFWGASKIQLLYLYLLCSLGICWKTNVWYVYIKYCRLCAFQQPCLGGFFLAASLLLSPHEEADILGNFLKYGFLSMVLFFSSDEDF